MISSRDREDKHSEHVVRIGHDPFDPPLSFFAKCGKSIERVFMRILGVDRLALLEGIRYTCHRNFLISQADQMHFNSVHIGIVDRFVSE